MNLPDDKVTYLHLVEMCEFKIHAAIVEWLTFVLPPDSIVHHSPNEGRHNVAYRAKQKRMGMQAGWPDIEILVYHKYFHRPLLSWGPIFLEVKSAKGRVSKAQKEMIKRLDAIGAHCAVVRSIDDTADYLATMIDLKVY